MSGNDNEGSIENWVLFPRIDLGEIQSPHHSPGLYFFSISPGWGEPETKEGSKNPQMGVIILSQAEI